MKKLITLLFAVLLLGLVNAQNVAQESGNSFSAATVEKSSFNFSITQPLVAESDGPAAPLTRANAGQNRAVIFQETFESAPTTVPFDLPAGWTSIATPGCSGTMLDVSVCAWSTCPWTDFTAHGGSRCMNAIYNETTNQDSWAFTPGFNLTSGSSYTISFWVRKASTSYSDRVEVFIGNSATVAAMTTTVYNVAAPPTAWTQISYTFNPTTTGTFYLGFHNPTTADQWYVLIDDIEVKEAGADLALNMQPYFSNTTYGFINLAKKIPLAHATGLYLPVRILNSGTTSAAAGSYTFQVGINGPAPSSASIYSVTSSPNTSALAAGVATSTILTTPFSITQLGTYTTSGTVTFTGDVDPTNNTDSRTIEITDHTFAVDEDNVAGYYGSASAITLGTPYTFKATENVTQIQAKFSTTAYSGQLNFKIYSINTSTTANAATEVYTQAFTKPVDGNWYTLTLTTPQTLTAGTYLFAINQNSTTNMGLGCVATMDNRLYGISGTNMATYSNAFIPAIRVTTAAAPSTPAAVSNLQATPNGSSCQLSWNNPTLDQLGGSLSSISSVVIQRNGTTVNTYTTNLTPGGTCSWTDNTVPPVGANYTYTVYAVNNQGNGAQSSVTAYVGPCVDVRVGTGTTGVSYEPINTYYEHYATQQIYLASELSTGDCGNITSTTIEGISIPYFFGTSFTATNVVIRLANTTKSTFASTSDWVSFAGLTTVFEGTVQLSNTNSNWVDITFTTPFEWDGISNIAVTFIGNPGNYLGSSATFYTHSTSPSYRALYTQNITSSFSTTTNPGTGTRQYNRNNMKFHFGAPPTCPAVSNLATSGITINSATISWTAGGTEPEWLFSYKLQASSTWSSEIKVTSNSYLLSGISPSSEYDIRVRPLCSPGDTGRLKIASFSTPCLSETNFPFTETFDGTGSLNNGNYVPTSCWKSYSSGAFPWDRVTSGSSPSCTPTGAGMLRFNSFNYASGSRGALVSPGFSSSGVLLSVAFDFYHYSSNSTTDQVNIYALQNAPASMTEISSATPIATIIQREGTTGWKHYEFDLPAYPTVYVVFEGISYYGYNMYIDNFTVEPKALKVTTFTPANASEGAPVETEISANFNISSIQILNPSNISISPSINYTLSIVGSKLVFTHDPLEYETEYTVTIAPNTIRATDGSNLQNQNTISWTFKTARNCFAYTLPIKEGFESNEVNDFLSCWTRIWSGTVNIPNINTLYVGSGTPPAARTGSGDFIFSSYSSNAAGYGQYLIAPQLPATSNPKYFSFWHRAYGTSNDIIEIGYSSTGTNITDFTWTGQLAKPTTYTQYQGLIPATAKYVAFHYMVTSSLYFYAIDDILIAGYNTGINYAHNDYPVTANISITDYNKATITVPEGYHLENITYNGSPAAPSSITATTITGYTQYVFTFTPGEQNNIEALIKVNNFVINYTIDGPGHINGTTYGDISGPVTGTITVNHDAEITIGGMCDYMTSLIIDGVAVNATNEHTWTLDPIISSNHTLNIVFVPNIINITTNVTGEGTLTPGDASWQCGESETYVYTATADPDYHISYIIVDGEYLPDAAGLTTYTGSFEPPITSSHNIEVYFGKTEIIYTVHTGIGLINNMVYADATQGDFTTTSYAAPGENFLSTFTAEPGYYTDYVLINGINMGSISQFNFYDVTVSQYVDIYILPSTFTVSTTSYGNGTISQGATFVYDPQFSYNYTVTPNQGYLISSIELDGETILENSEVAYNGTISAPIIENHNIIASFAAINYNITATAGIGGNINPVGTANYAWHATPSYSITANGGYYISALTVNGTPVTVPASAATFTYTFAALTADAAIDVTFAKFEYVVTSSVIGGNGSISPVGNNTVQHFDNITFTITPNTGYDIQKVLVDGVNVGTPSTYTFVSITDNHTVAAYFVKHNYTVSSFAGVGGTITASGEYEYQSNVTYSITPNTGYNISSVLVDGTNVGAVSTYLFSNISANHTIVANFNLKSYTITVQAPATGVTVTPSTSPVTVSHGGSQSFVITPSAGRVLSSVAVDGVSVTFNPNGTTYNFTNVTANHTLTIGTTAQVQYTINVSAGTGGTVTPGTITNYVYNDNATYAITPNAGYEIARVVVDGFNVGAVSTFTFTNITANHTISATFAPKNCEFPEILSVTALTETSANLNWENTGAASYKVRYKAFDASTFTESPILTTTQYPINGLTKNTLYYFSVKAYCSSAAGHESDWSANSQFTTVNTSSVSSVNAGIDIYSYINTVYIVNNSNLNIENVSIFDIYGKLIYQGVISSTKEAISLDIANGTYIVRVQTNESVKVEKINISK